MAIYVLSEMRFKWLRERAVGRAYKKALAQTDSYFIAKILCFPATLHIRRCALALKMFGVAVENLEHWRPRCLDGIITNTE